MPVNIVIGLFALLGALVLYSMGVWGAFRSKTVSRRHVTYLFVGFGFDVVATAMMAIAAGGLDLSPLPDLIHTVLALLAMFGMLAAAIGASRAIDGGGDAMKVTLVRWMMLPWVLWVAVFVWGMLARGSQRLG